MNNWDFSNQIALTEAVRIQSQEGQALAQDKIQAKALLDLAQEFMLDQVIQDPTRGLAILDLRFSNNEDLFTNVQTVNHVNFSDHNTIVAGMSVCLSPSPPPPVVNFTASSLPEYGIDKLSNEEWDMVSSHISSSDWSNFGNEDTIDAMYQTFLSILEVAVSKVAT
jgi:hypothetical protein